MTNKETYKTICKQYKGVPIFQQYWWMDAVCKEWDVAITYNGDKVSGVWPYAIERKGNVSLRRNQFLSAYCGPHVFFPHDLKQSKRDNFEHEAITALLGKMPAAKVWHLSLQPGLKQAGLFKGAGFDVQVKQTFLMDLREETDAVFAKLNEDYRRNIRKAEAELTISDEPQCLLQLYGFLKATLQGKDVQLYYSEAQMQRLFAACIANNSTSLWVARKGDAVQAIVWEVWDDGCAYYLAGAKNPAEKDNRAMTALLWHAIKAAIQMGKKVFDFEGSMDVGVEKFFRNFGAERELYLTIQKNDSLLWKLKEKIKG
ncbi:MAG: GNAT family N-acetyltransferase [Bacteroidetes bacterium]|nr:GNAT family N-acetyltransferase [Bacteroidota bacterium]